LLIDNLMNILSLIGPIVTENIISHLLGKSLTSHTPQKEFLGLISTGDKYAVASRGDHALEGDFLWRLKDEIDVGWMSMYKNLPSMEDMEDEKDDETDVSQKIPSILEYPSKEDILAAFMEAPMRCGGCGSKVGSHTLTRVLDAIHKRNVSRALKKGSDVKAPKKIDPDDAAIIMLPESGGAMIQTIDFFRSFISDPFIFGKIAAVHALSDCHAMGADAHSALALAVVNFSANESITEATLIDMLSGASEIFENENCELSGGHTCEGSAQALGFSVTGFVQNPSHLLRKRGGKVGDKIILTKPIGTGALFAAEMRARCHGEHVHEALECMMISNYTASRVARQFIGKGVHACTDVTGFGLIGHLIEMLIANDTCQDEFESIAAIVDLNAVPFFRGALEASSNGIASSLFRENFRSRRAVQNHEEAAVADPTKYPLLFDPQTAGGLLLFVSPDVCDELLSLMHQEGSIANACVIGELNPYSPMIHTDSCELNGSCTLTNDRIIIKV
jgi:selenide, water dikinase